MRLPTQYSKLLLQWPLSLVFLVSAVGTSKLPLIFAQKLNLIAAPVARVLGTGALAAGADLFGRGFRAMLSGDEAGIAMMRAAFRTFRALSVGGEVSETASKIARIVRTAGAVLSILGVVLDGIVLVYAAIEGAKQKEELQQYVSDRACLYYLDYKLLN